MILYACIAVVLVTILCAYPWWRYRRARKLLSHLPSLQTMPLLGNFHLFLGDGEYFLHQMSTISKIMDALMTSFVMWMGPIPILIPSVTDPQDLKTIASAYVDKPYQYSFSKSFDNGLITAPGCVYKHTSRKLLSAFSNSVVAGYQDIMNVHARKLVELMKTEAGKEPFNINKSISWMTLEAIYYTTFGKPSTSECIVPEEYNKALNRAMKLYCKRGMLIPLYSNFLYGLTSDSKELAGHENILNETVLKLIENRKQERQKMHKEITAENNNGGKKKPTFKPYIDILLELSETEPRVFTQEQITSELNTIIAAGHETVANTLTFCLLMIGSHPGVQDKLYAEMKSVFGDSKRPVTKEDLAQMPYCEAVINETLRLYPAVPCCFRDADKDLNLSTYTVPKNTTCGINVFGAGRSMHIWGNDAEVFRPERWFEFPPDQTPFFIPFSIGKRPCIGKKYAMTMLKTCIAHVSRELIIKSDIKKLRIRVYITLQPFRGNEIQVLRR